MERKIDIVITMGGVGKRFREAGYPVPKYMIEVKGRTLFEWSIISLEGYRNKADLFVFIALKDSEIDVETFIKEKCIILGIDKYKIILLDYLTDGQATTALLAEKYWSLENSLIIYNIDTYVEPGFMNSEELRGDGFIPCFKAEGAHWSFVKLDSSGKVIEIKEKEKISDNCTLGAYYFKTCKLYKELYLDFYKDSHNMVNGEKYIAPLYNCLLKCGGKIYISDVPADRVHVLGTPEELLEFEKQ